MIGNWLRVSDNFADVCIFIRSTMRIPHAKAIVICEGHLKINKVSRIRGATDYEAPISAQKSSLEFTLIDRLILNKLANSIRIDCYG